MSHCPPPAQIEAHVGSDMELSPAMERALERLLPSPEAVVIAAAERLLYLQDRHASGYPEPAISYESNAAPLLARPGVVTVRITGDTGSGSTPSVPAAVVEALEFVDLLRVFEAARDATAHLLPLPLLAGGVWWSVRMAQEPLASLVGEGATPAQLRRAMLEYEGAVASGLAQHA